MCFERVWRCSYGETLTLSSGTWSDGENVFLVHSEYPGLVRYFARSKVNQDHLDDEEHLSSHAAAWL